MARSSRLSVRFEIETRNSSQSHWPRSTGRRRTTPWIGGTGPPSIAAASAARWASVGQPRRLTRRLAVDQASRPLGVGPQHPVADDLQGHAAEPRRLAPRRAVADRRQSRKPTRLPRIFRAPRQRTQLRRIVVGAKGKRLTHGEAPVLASLNQIRPASGIPLVSQPQQDLV